MKIKKEFIPLILSGEKKYEFIDCNGCHEGIYLVNGEYLKLEYLGCVFANHVDEFIRSDCNTMWVQYWGIPDPCEIIIDSSSAKWIRDNSSYFLEKNEQGYLLSSMHVYEWKKINFKQLEIEEYEND